eukprot:6485089-Amphidinium_carterae.1
MGAKPQFCERVPCTIHFVLGSNTDLTLCCNMRVQACKAALSNKVDAASVSSLSPKACTRL